MPPPVENLASIYQNFFCLPSIRRNPLSTPGLLPPGFAPARPSFLSCRSREIVYAGYNLDIGSAPRNAWRHAVKILLGAVILTLALFLAACGGGGGVTPPPPGGNFTLASLKGQYAFSMNGVDPTGAYIARIGSFISDGAGNITAGLEDVLPLATGQPAVVNFTGGNYSIQSNGRGVLVLQAASGGGLQLNFDMQSPTAGFLLETDKNNATSGTFSLQTPADFTNGSLVSQYAFNLAGISFGANSVAPISIVGEINSDGNGAITSGLIDTNDGNAQQPSAATPVPPGTYQVDTNGNGSSFGRGTMSFAGRSFAFYIVDSTHFLLLEEDALGGSSGDALKQVSPPSQNSQFAGNSIFLVGGASLLGTQGPVATVGRFTADGNGALNAVTADDNNDGRHVHIQNGSNVSNATYTIDANHPGSGRGTFTFTNSGTGTYSFTFYAVSASQAFVQDTSPGYIATGPMYSQGSGPFSLQNLAGDYVFNWSGVQLANSTAVPLGEDYIGQFTLANATSNSVNGVVDYTQIGVSSNNLYTNVNLTGNLLIDGDGTADNKYTFNVNSSPTATIHFQVYFSSNGTAFMVTADSTRTTAGVIKLQAP